MQAQIVEDPEASLVELDWRRPHQEWSMSVQLVRLSHLHAMHKGMHHI